MSTEKPIIPQHEYRARQAQLLGQCKPNSIIVLRGASEITRSRDTEFPFRQDSDFFYLTGFNEPDAWLILSNQLDGCFRAMVVREKDPEQEIWHGRRLGTAQAKRQFNLDVSYASDALAEALLTLLDGHEHLYWSLAHQAAADEAIQACLVQLKSSRMKQCPATVVDWQPLVHEMRLHKSSSEIAVMTYAANVSCSAHQRAMQYAHANCFEYQLAAEIHHEFALAGAAAPAYNTIVGAGENACILHYTENTDQVQNGQLVLIDAGAEYAGYAADITRTFPVNGKFSAPQKALYDLVLSVQEMAIEQLVPGVTVAQVSDMVVEGLIEGLVALGLLNGEINELIKAKAHRRFYMHGLGHWLGLDVHDVGAYKVSGEDRKLAPGMVLTVEPGLYIPNEPDIDVAYRAIGIRIEDNIVITEKGNTVLTAAVPKSVDGIEALMAHNKAN